MRQLTILLTLCAVLMLGAPAALAGEWTGYLMDTMCAPTKKDQAVAHTAACMKSCAGSGFGLVTPDGEYVRFDEKGNALANQALAASAKKEGLEVSVNGERKGKMIRVSSIEMR